MIRLAIDYHNVRQRESRVQEIYHFPFCVLKLGFEPAGTA